MNKQMIGILDSLDTANIPALQGNGKIYDGTTTYDVVEGWDAFEYTQPVTIFIVADIFTTDIMCFLAHTSPTSNGGIALYKFLDTIYSDFYNDPTGVTNRKTLLGTKNLKLGRVAFATTVAGTLSGINDKFYINGLKDNPIITQDTLSATIINDSNKLLIGRFGLITGIYYCNLKFKKLQILNFEATPAQLNNALNQYSFEGLTSDANFLLDVDFNKTTGNPLTTRAGTPTYTITPYGSNVFSSFL